MTSEALEILYKQKSIICSYSGANEWLHDFTLELMNLYTGSSPYNHSLCDCNHHYNFPAAFEKNPESVCVWVRETLDKEWAKHMYKMIENIIDDVPDCEFENIEID